MADAIDWAIEAAANVANEQGSPYRAVLIGQDGSVLGTSAVVHGARSVTFNITRTGQAKQVEFGGHVFPVDPQYWLSAQEVSYGIYWS